MDANQLEPFLFNHSDESGKGEDPSLQEADPAPSPKARSWQSRSERWPSDIPVVEAILDPAEVVAAPEDWRFIGANFSEQLDYKPAKFLRRKIGSSQICSPSGPGCCLCGRPDARSAFGTLHRGTGTAGGDHRGKILRPPASLPTGTHF
jgi:hypothetical protein